MGKKAEAVTVYPVPGFFIMGVPTVAQEVTPEQAEHLVATGAFSLEPQPDAPAPEPQPDAPAPVVEE